MPTKYKIDGAAMLIRWWPGPPVLVIVTCPPAPAVQIRTSRSGPASIQTRVPQGPVEVKAVNKQEKRFLLSQGVHPGLFKSHRVFAVSDEIARRFDSEGEAFIDVASQCGLSKTDVMKLIDAKRKLAAMRPTSSGEKRAARALRELLGCGSLAKERGRPQKITAEDRIQMRANAQDLRQQGKTTDEIVRILAQRYELRISYAKRILEDAM